ncbi:hypothetical protein GALMADRAFT_1073681 [Galerina marginata CBS 339.88]|uniref:Uncharacterized protein n=1 Tax=Galerina marginata (strain CBS 339.88) TaxID=685588 RepID=A0A067SCH9_GALM3|nr:hypothetical protein GALMADRAFT_1073681 [Galerina marginata CBS 339.88]
MILLLLQRCPLFRKRDPTFACWTRAAPMPFESHRPLFRTRCPPPLRLEMARRFNTRRRPVSVSQTPRSYVAPTSMGLDSRRRTVSCTEPKASLVATLSPLYLVAKSHSPSSMLKITVVVRIIKS